MQLDCTNAQRRRGYKDSLVPELKAGATRKSKIIVFETIALLSDSVANRVYSHSHYSLPLMRLQALASVQNRGCRLLNYWLPTERK
ncbi:hypothetical protein H6G96_29535 [Nostoc sp. FACHB-892]|uniref:hypothetical protein n=1 Tax=Nostoc sp. FACHB-892 TaxID=2692843 RepID=UPI0016843288|nr:hypothetical protein [Nostoc sp. FACHB-892]MBD2730348.1 hypothetical protein [Nostoc sp. FACHB-892]